MRTWTRVRVVFYQAPFPVGLYKEVYGEGRVLYLGATCPHVLLRYDPKKKYSAGRINHIFLVILFLYLYIWKQTLTLRGGVRRDVG